MPQQRTTHVLDLCPNKPARIKANRKFLKRGVSFPLPASGLRTPGKGKLTPFNRPKCPYFGGWVERAELSVSLCDESPQSERDHGRIISEIVIGSQEKSSLEAAIFPKLL